MESNKLSWQIIIFITAQETNMTSAIGPKVIDWEVTNWLVCTLGWPLLHLFRIIARVALFEQVLTYIVQSVRCLVNVNATGRRICQGNRLSFGKIVLGHGFVALNSFRPLLKYGDANFKHFSMKQNI